MIYKGSLMKRVFLSAVYFVLAAVSATQVWADTDFKLISTEALKAIIDEKKVFALIDARTKEEYHEAHIVKAINVPEKQFKELVSTLPVDKNSLLVFYCNGVKCGKSKKVAKLASEAGYSNILIYSEGFPVWEEKNFPIAAGPEYGKKIETTKLGPAEVKSLIAAGKDDYVLVDVRDASEFKEGHIPTAVNIPAETFASKSEVLPKEKKIIVYCNTGSRSYMAYRKLGKLAYSNIYQTLFAEWKETGLPVEKNN